MENTTPESKTLSHFENTEGIIPHPQSPEKNQKRLWFHILLFVLTLVTTTLAGLTWLNLWWPYDPLTVSVFMMGLPFSVSLLFILGTHEFGHYFAAVYHRVKTTLPYFIPFPPLPFIFNFGTFGAVIRTQSAIKNEHQLIDIGAYGPIAGFVATLVVLFAGIVWMPPFEYIYSIHPEYQALGFIPEGSPTDNQLTLFLGNNLLFMFLNHFVFPYYIPMSEIYHYPLLFAGWIGLFITALNLLPFGQLDGGHISYAVFGALWHERLSKILIVILLSYGAVGFLPMTSGFEAPIIDGWGGWFLWGLILWFALKYHHPPILESQSLSPYHKRVSWTSLIIFILSVPPVPFNLV